MNVYRCRICGDPYIGSDRPTHCPFCGAHQKYLAAAADYQPPAIVDLSGKSRESLERALELEIDNSNFYRGAAKVADTEEGKALFQALARVEAEHVAIVCRILAIPRPEELGETGECSPAHKENLAESRRREERAARLYGRFLEEATEDRVKEVLTAFVEIENDHLVLAQ